SGMFVQSVEFIRAHAKGNGNGGKARADISIYGQESNYTTWRLARMNLAIRGIDGQIAHGDSFHNDRFPDLKADYILANPPFNVSDWRGELLREDKRWQYGVPPAGNANFAWMQHMVYHLAPTGLAGFVLANGSMSSNQSGEGDIRKNLIEADMVDRTHRELTDDDIARIARTYHAWRGDVSLLDLPDLELAKALGEEIEARIREQEQMVLQYIEKHGRITRKEAAELC
ncbi:MAG: N-6 DNA methylase, partial [Nitrospinae bacterium]|nr:N-6 DNA methylase [Nitrospinota bacterium]